MKGKDVSIKINCCCSVAKSCPTLCDPMDCSTPGFPVLHCLPEFAQIHVHLVGDAIESSHPLYCPLLPVPSIFPSIKVFSNESALCLRWPKYWSFSFSINPSNEYSGLHTIFCKVFNLCFIFTVGMIINASCHVTLSLTSY